MNNLIESVALHEYPEYLDKCIDIICEEWGRSRMARRVMLEKSCPSMPYNIILILKSPGSNVQVVGHSRLCVVLYRSNCAYVETVVVSKSLRGMGLGRRLMEETEKHAIRLGIKTLCLTTTDKQDFYKHLGYSFSKPIVSIGSASCLLSKEALGNLFKKDEENNKSVTIQQNTANKLAAEDGSPINNNTKTHYINMLTCHSTRESPSIPILPPPPPPLPLCLTKPINANSKPIQGIFKIEAYNMEKCLA